MQCQNAQGWVMCGMLRLTQQACRMPEGSWNCLATLLTLGMSEEKSVLSAQRL